MVHLAEKFCRGCITVSRRLNIGRGQLILGAKFFIKFEHFSLDEQEPLSY
jgi:hypothetical protein